MQSGNADENDLKYSSANSKPTFHGEAQNSKSVMSNGSELRQKSKNNNYFDSCEQKSSKKPVLRIKQQKGQFNSNRKMKNAAEVPSSILTSSFNFQNEAKAQPQSPVFDTIKLSMPRIIDYNNSNLIDINHPTPAFSKN